MDPEHIEPVRSLTLDRRSRARTFLVALLPAFLLIAVIGAAIFGSGGSSDEADVQADRDVEAPTSAPPQLLASDAPDVAGLREAGFPTRALGLPVHSVARTLELHEDGHIQSDVVAVAGWLSVPPDPACGVDVIDDRPGLYGTGASCRRETILAGDAEPVVAARSGTLRHLREAPVALRPVGLPGPSLASIAARQIAPDRVVLPERAIVLGRFGDPRLPVCQASSTDCRSAFAIERVVWVDGSWRLRRPLLFPSEVEPVPSGQVRWPTVDRAIRRGAIILSESIVSRDDLATVDPAADAATRRDVATVWYVRALLRARGLDNPVGEVGWAVIDDDTATVLASDPERTTAARATTERSGSATPSPDQVAIPEQMFGLDVLDVGALQRLVESGVDQGQVVAVEGWLTVAPDQEGCTELPVIACPRRGTLSGTREPDGPVVAVETLPGTPLLGLTRQSPSLGTWTVPNRVALVGRLHEQPSACGLLIRCDLVLTIERLAWLRTAARDRPVLTAPGSLEATWTREAAEKAARDAIDGAGATLLLAVVDARTLRLLDAAAWDEIGAPAANSAFWYLRTIAWQSPLGLDGPATVAWSVIDDRTHAVLGTGVGGAAP
ncbi:MAG TPA: hypothetical protein VFU17_10020 [Candidatus Limnocylindrales bacterium]|nr:hypothetical protein [Candidatus Limnocylindrales bacterium]